MSLQFDFSQRIVYVLLKSDKKPLHPPQTAPFYDEAVTSVRLYQGVSNAISSESSRVMIHLYTSMDKSRFTLNWRSSLLEHFSFF